MAAPTFSLSEIKKELTHLSAKELVEICLSLAKLKKENKAYLVYKLYNEHNLDGFINQVNAETTEMFNSAAFLYTHTAKKTLRKILKTITQNIRFAKDKKVEVELLMHFCKLFKSENLLHCNTVLDNLYASQIKKIDKALSMLHEDFQYDYNREIEELKNGITLEY
ncbi:MAG: hypothetical protein ORN55_06465 [Chitinophagaceae bacterium]|jgi:hypothetical protein|nr:hypothetical protein [Chitinophagaceae bacterium]